MKDFRFGIINEQMKPPTGWIDHVKQVESLGFSTFLIRDHFVPDFFGEQVEDNKARMTYTNHPRFGSIIYRQ